MGILERSKRKEVRFHKGEFIIYELTDEQRLDLMDMVRASNSIKVSETEITGDIDSSIVKHIMREYTSLGAEVDEHTDAELDILLSDGDRNAQLFMRGIKELMEEIVEDIMYEYSQDVKNNIQLINTIEKEIDAEKMIERMLKVFKKQGISLTKEELIENINNPEKFNDLITKKRKVTKKKK